MLSILKLRSHHTAMINNLAVSKFGPEAIEICEPFNFNSCSQHKICSTAAASVLLIKFKGAILEKIAPSVAHFKKEICRITRGAKHKMSRIFSTLVKNLFSFYLLLLYFTFFLTVGDNLEQLFMHRGTGTLPWSPALN